MFNWDHYHEKCVGGLEWLKPSPTGFSFISIPPSVPTPPAHQPLSHGLPKASRWKTSILFITSFLKWTLQPMIKEAFSITSSLPPLPMQNRVPGRRPGFLLEHNRTDCSHDTHTHTLIENEGPMPVPFPGHMLTCFWNGILMCGGG